MTDGVSPAADEPDPESPEDPVTREGTRRSIAWMALAGLLLVAGVTSLYGEVWRRGPARFVPRMPTLVEPGSYMDHVDIADYRLVIGRVAGNARALAYTPSRIFQKEQCYPADDVLAVGDPMLTSGLLALPGYLASSDPLVAYNTLLVLLALLSGAAMCALVWNWSGVPAAGIVAGLLYALHEYKISNASHAFIFDTVWIVLALFFVQRLFERGRIRDGAALGICCVLQMAEGFYALLGAILLAIPVSIWLVVRKRGLPAWPGLVTALGFVAAGAIWLFSPYLEAIGDHPASVRLYAAWYELTPWHVTGGLGAALVFVALLTPRRVCLADPRVDPRWPLLLGILLIAVISAGGNIHTEREIWLQLQEAPPALPDPYDFLAQYIPGLAQVRAPMMISVVGQLALCILAGLGAGAVVRLAPQRTRAPVGILLVLLVWVLTLRPSWVGLEPRTSMLPFEIRPTAELLAFYDRLSELGNTGPLLEFPTGTWPSTPTSASRQVFLSAYHHRRTSGCYMSVIPDSVKAGYYFANGLLPDVQNPRLRALRDTGFTTIVIHHREARLPKGAKAALDRAASRKGSLIRRLHQTQELTAYEILPALR